MLRFSGMEGSVTLLNNTTGDALVPDIHVVSYDFTAEYELTEQDFIGEIGKEYREFYVGYSLKITVQPNLASQIVALANLFKAKGQGANIDEISAGLKYVSPDGGSFRIVCRDLHTAPQPMKMGGRTKFAENDLDFKGKLWLMKVA